LKSHIRVTNLELPYDLLLASVSFGDNHLFINCIRWSKLVFIVMDAYTYTKSGLLSK
jgi:hypothetical protein